MENRTLEINVMSAKDLNKVNLIAKMDVYVVVYISGDDNKSKDKIKTPVDREGGSNPTWNFPMKFTVDVAAAQQNRLTLVFKLKCDRALGDKDVGEVHVPIKELIESNEALDGKQFFVSYQVRKPSGKPKGQISFSYKFGEKVVAKVDPHHDEPMMAYPVSTTNHMVGPTPASGYVPPPPPVQGGAYPPPAMSTESGSSYPPPGKTSESGNYPPPSKPSESGSSYPPPGKTSESGSYPPPGSGPYAPPGGDGYHHHYPPPPHGYAAPSAGYPYPHPQPTGYGYPPPPAYGGYPPPPAPGYGYPPQQGYGHPPVQQQAQPPKKNNKFGLGLGAGLLGGALGGLLIGDMVSDAADFGDGGFDF